VLGVGFGGVGGKYGKSFKAGGGWTEQASEVLKQNVKVSLACCLVVVPGFAPRMDGLRGLDELIEALKA
jgi:hypothetical protein